MSSHVQDENVAIFLVNQKLPLAFTDLLGALLLGSWNYTIENSCVLDVNRVDIYGFHVTELGEPSGRLKDLKVAWEYRGDDWVLLTEETGFVRAEATKDGRHIDSRAVDRLVDYIGNNINDWAFLPIDDDEPEPTTEPEPEAETGQKAIGGRKAIGTGKSEATPAAGRGSRKASSPRPKRAAAKPKAASVVTEEVIEEDVDG